MADRSVASLHVYILHIIALLIQHRDPSSSSLPINAQVSIFMDYGIFKIIIDFSHFLDD